ncbi:MAG: GIY-YIG nuclease family protein, partial [Bacteroidetes bacterium]|nr:GIY-YIG nuclease family protein [Bacteroidota bacterium]
MFHIYIIYSKSADKYYIGHTNDVDRRITEHNSDPKMTYTHKFRP